MKRACFALAAFALALVLSPARAAFHNFRIDQVYSNADGSVQYVVLVESMGTNGEQFWAGNRLTAGASSFTFPNNLPSSSTASRKVLVATSGFAALGVLAPDFTVPNGFFPIGGATINYANADQVTYGPLPTDGGTAVDRNGARVAATPTNFSGATVTLTAAPPPPVLNIDQHGLTGSWFEASTSGQGIELEFFQDLGGAGVAVVQGAWFTFDTAAGGEDHQRWFTFSGNAVSGQTSVPVTIFQNVGGNFNAAPTTNAVAVGTATLSFVDCDHATFTYMFASGRAGSIDLTRLLRNVTCAVGAAATTNADFAFSGNWFNATTSGQGFVMEVNPALPFFFLTWYTYAPSGQAAGAGGQRWFTAQNAYAPGSRTIVATLFETTGGAFDATAPAASTMAVGSATITFMSCAAAQVQFNFTGGSEQGKSGTIALTRVGPVPPGCAMSATDVPTPPPMGYPPGPYGP